MLIKWYANVRFLGHNCTHCTCPAQLIHDTVNVILRSCGSKLSIAMKEIPPKVELAGTMSVASVELPVPVGTKKGQCNAAYIRTILISSLSNR